MSLGSIELPDEAIVLTADVLQRNMTADDPPLLIAIVYCLDDALYHRIYALEGFPSAPLERIVRTSSSIYSHLGHAMVALEDAKKAWTEAHSLWQTWLEKIASDETTGKAARLAEARAILMRFVASGRAPTSLREYLSSKNNERAFAKVEQNMSQALGQLGMISIHHLGPVVERVLMRLEEMLGWARWKDKMGSLLRLDEPTIERAIALATDLYRRITDFDTVVRQEWNAWPEVRKWLRVELERAAALTAAATAQSNMNAAQRARDREREKNAKPHPNLFAHDAMAVAAYLNDGGKGAAAITGALDLDLSAALSPWSDELPAAPESPASVPPSWTEVEAAMKGGPKLRQPTLGIKPVGDSLGLLFAELARTTGIAFGKPLTRIAKAAKPVSDPRTLFALGSGDAPIARSRSVRRQ